MLSIISRAQILLGSKQFHTTAFRLATHSAASLRDRIKPKYQKNQTSELLSLQWPSPPQNILMIKKHGVQAITDSLIEYAKYIHKNYANISLIFEPSVASEVDAKLPFPIYTSSSTAILPCKTDLVTTLGGDGTILHASSLFSTTEQVPPVLAFSMGSLGFLGEWKFAEYKRAFREVYMSGASAGSHLLQDQRLPHASLKESGDLSTEWPSVRGKSMGSSRSSKVLLRNRLKVGVFDGKGRRISGDDPDASAGHDIHAMNEVIIHRGKEAHLAVIEVFLGGRFLTEAVADGMIVATPTGSTAYSLSSGGSIIHPLVSSLMLTPICPRSLSFRPLVLPANTLVTLRLSEKNRGRELEVSIDGRRRSLGVGVGMEIRVSGEEITKGTQWVGGIPYVMRGVSNGLEDDDGWVGGLNGLLKFNYPFGEE